MRHTLYILLWILCSGLYAQNICFELQSDGSFKTNDGNSFVVIEHKNLSAAELYDLYSVASIKGYRTERRVTNTVEGKAFSIEGITDTLSLKGSGTVVVKYEFQIMFHFKDERVRIDAPFFGDTYASMKMFGSYGTLVKQSNSFSEWVKSKNAFIQFEEGVLRKEKYKKNWNRINQVANELVECIVKNIEDAKGEDW